MKEKYRRDYLKLPNIPDINLVYLDDVAEKIVKQRTKYKMILSYVGVFDSDRGLEDILKYVANNNEICINIAGFGKLENYVINLSTQFENIIYWGKVDYNLGLNIMNQSDIIVAFYYLNNKTHKYAAPNKYYESLYLGKAILTNNGTEFSEKVKTHNTGFVIDEGYKSISNFFQNKISKEELLQKQENSFSLWEKYYKDYTKDFMKRRYLKLID